jgi:hypothetical protein
VGAVTTYGLCGTTRTSHLLHTGQGFAVAVPVGVGFVVGVDVAVGVAVGVGVAESVAVGVGVTPPVVVPASGVDVPWRVKTLPVRLALAVAPPPEVVALERLTEVAT